MSKEIVIDVKKMFTAVAFYENSKLRELEICNASKENILKSIYIGKVKNVINGMNAIFVDIGIEQNAYMSYNPKSEDKIKIGDELLVQVIKEPIGQKGATVTQDIKIPGRYVVLSPKDDYIGVSNKIGDETIRNKISNLVLKNSKGYGFIVRTNSVNATEVEILEEIKYLINIWEDIQSFSKYKACYSVVYQEKSQVITLLRDMLNADISKVYINDVEYYNEVVDFVSKLNKQYVSKIILYDDKNLSLSNLFKLDGSIKKLLREKVWLKSGASLVIQQTEALVSIDVNSSKNIGKKQFDKTIFEVNKEAAIEIARQVKLRNLSGIIIIDFIDMKEEINNINLIEIFKKELKKDRVKTCVLGMTKLGLLEMTRKKTSKSLSNKITTECSACQGKGRVMNNLS